MRQYILKNDLLFLYKKKYKYLQNKWEVAEISLQVFFVKKYYNQTKL